MRYPPDHKQRVRQRIIRAAARRFRGSGTERVSIARLMRDLKLTHGGFYRHFSGKEQLFNEALAESFAQVQARLNAAAEQAPAGHELEAIIGTYLSQEHCANASEGCPVAALATEIGRHRGIVRNTLDAGVREHAAMLARFMPGATAAERECTAVVVFAGMAGALNLARATADPALRRSILDGARTFYIESLRAFPKPPRKSRAS